MLSAKLGRIADEQINEENEEIESNSSQPKVCFQEDGAFHNKSQFQKARSRHYDEFQIVQQMKKQGLLDDEEDEEEDG